MGDSAESKYDMLLGIDILTSLGLNLKLSEHVITEGEKLYEGCTVLMAIMMTYDHKPSNISDQVLPEESCMDACVE